MHLLGIPEIGGQGIGNIGGMGSGAVFGVKHIHCYAAMEQKSRHGLDFRMVGGVVQSVGHEVPIVEGVAIIGREQFAGACSIAMGARPYLRKLPEMHDLSHGHRHTAYLGVAAGTAHDGTEAVVEASLMPMGRNQWRHFLGRFMVVELAGGLYQAPLPCGEFVGNNLIVDAILDSCDEIL